MSNKISLLGLRDIETDETLNEQTDYGLFLIASMVSREFPCTHDQFEKDTIKYKLKVINCDSIVDLKTSKGVEFQHGKSPSQKLRWLIEQNLGVEEYSAMIGYLMGRIDGLCDEYRESRGVDKCQNKDI